MICVDSPAPGWTTPPPIPRFCGRVLVRHLLLLSLQHWLLVDVEEQECQQRSRGSESVWRWKLGIQDLKTFMADVKRKCRPGALENMGDRRPCPWVTGSCEYEREGSGTGGERGCGRGGCRQNPYAAVLRQALDGKKGQPGGPCLVWWCKVQKETLQWRELQREGVRPAPSESPSRAESAISFLPRHTRC